LTRFSFSAKLVSEIRIDGTGCYKEYYENLEKNITPRTDFEDNVIMARDKETISAVQYKFLLLAFYEDVHVAFLRVFS
jgi:hypothetical protein